MSTPAIVRVDEAEQGTSLWQDAWLRLRRNRLAVCGLFVLVLFIVIAVLTPWIAPYGYAQQQLELGATPPSPAHWLGTDIFGRDLLTQIMYGGRISLAVGFLATAVALLIGVSWGAVAGYAGGRVDAVMMRLVDILYALPFMIFIVLLMVVFGRNLLLLFLAIGAVEWLTMARIMRAQVQSLRQQEFVEAAISLGLSPAAIIRRHIIPNALGPIIVYTTLTIPGVMLLEAFLSFLGLGVQPPQTSWGLLISYGAESLEEYPWLLLYPGLALTLTLFSLNFLGDGLRDALDVRAALRTDRMLQVEHLSVSFVTRMGTSKAVDDISFSVESGKITAIIGESGSGKSVACYSLLGLIPQPPGRVDGGRALFQGQDLLQLDVTQLRKIRGRDIAMVFQDPMTCLNPYMTVGKQLMEPLRYHKKVSRAAARERALELLEEVGIREPTSTFDNYPHQFSGGMRQRVMIAMALINEPRLLIADEPTTALDVTIQAQILELLASIQKKRAIGVLLISHDLAVVADIADQIVVMQEGRIVEAGDRNGIFRNARHPYTRKLLQAIPTGGKSEALSASEPIVEVRNLCTWFQQGTGMVKAVDDVSFDVHRGEVLGLVGESGSGKSTIGRSILRLVPVTSGKVYFDGVDATALHGNKLKDLRRRMQIIFQDPYASLNPRMTVYDTLAEPLLLHGITNRDTVAAQVLQLMDDVGLARAFVRKYPHEFSGGQRQRIAIGRALATRPEFVVADEPVSALDVTIQAQILDLMRELGREYGLTMLFISHDLAVVRQLADRIVVLHEGRVVEQARTQELFKRPQQAYTQQLLQSIPGRSLLVTEI